MDSIALRAAAVAAACMIAGCHGCGSQPVMQLPSGPPTLVAPPLDRTVVTNLADASAFLYSGASPIQTGVVPGTIDRRRVAVVRGLARDASGTPLPGVTVSVLGHTELGQTVTRADGMFDLAVNGGGPTTIEYVKDGLLPVQRKVAAPWLDYVWASEVVMLPLDGGVTQITSGAGAMQVARGSMRSDGAGVRQATVLFPAGTHASLRMPDGTSHALDTMHVRATEYTVGALGPSAMPAELPPSTAYTYAVAFTVDEAALAGASSVEFDRPVVAYIENFLHLPVGNDVPSGSYDPTRGAWVAADNGRVVGVLGAAGGLAQLDLDGSHAAAGAPALSALGISDDERRELATLYPPGGAAPSLWRMPLHHFSNEDWNLCGNLPSDWAAPADPPFFSKLADLFCATGGSRIECDNQILGEAAHVAGTPFSLVYSSERVPGRQSAYIVDIPLTGPMVPASLKGVELEILVAGQRVAEHRGSQPSQTKHYQWDGKDGYGRAVQGSQPITVRVGYTFDGTYGTPPQFGLPLGAMLTGNNTLKQLTVWTVWHGGVGPWDARALGLGGWSLSAHHAYDPNTRVLYLGDGHRRSAESLGKSIQSFAGLGSSSPGDGGPAVNALLGPVQGMAVAPDGTVFLADSSDHRIRRVGLDGIITTFAGTGVKGFSGDEHPAVSAQIDAPAGLDFGPDGSLYVSDTGNARIRRITPDGIIHTVAGDGNAGFGGDGGPATSAQIRPFGLAVAGDGTLYIADQGNDRVRRVGTDGKIYTVAGGGMLGTLWGPTDVALSPDGTLYIADTLNQRVVGLLDADDDLDPVAGTGVAGTSGDDGRAIDAQLRNPTSIRFGADGTLYIATPDDRVVRAVTPGGTIYTVAGAVGMVGDTGDGGPALAATFYEPSRLATGPGGELYVSDSFHHHVRRIAPPLPSLSLTDHALPSANGSEVYVFDDSGRHLKTLDGLTGAVKLTFGYDAKNLLHTLTDADKLATSIDRDAAGNVTITGPYGHATGLTLDAAGWLREIKDPSSDTLALVHGEGGLLGQLTDARMQVHVFGYDPLGRLQTDADPAGGSTTLARTDVGATQTVTRTTKLGRVTSYVAGRAADGALTRSVTLPSGLATKTKAGADGTTTTTFPDQSVLVHTVTGDPRLGPAAPAGAAVSIALPSGLTYVATTQRHVTLANPSDPFSIQAMSETQTVNGQSAVSTYDPGTRTLTRVSPSGRTALVTVDARGRVAGFQPPGLTPVKVGYDTHGRVATITQGVRTLTSGYDAKGQLGSLTDALKRTLALAHDASARLSQETFPGGAMATFTPDGDSNLAAVTPPGQPQHELGYSPINLLARYTPPDVGNGKESMTIAQDADRSTSLITRIDGQTIHPVYDPAGRLSHLTTPAGDVIADHDPVTGHLRSLTAPDGGKVSWIHDGPLVTDIAWAGAVTGSVHRTYDANLRVSALNVDSAGDVAFGFDADGAMTFAGPLTLVPDAQRGVPGTTSVGVVSDARSYNAFGELTGYSVTVSGATVLQLALPRDDLGRVTQKSETIQGVSHVRDYGYAPSGRLADVHVDGAMAAHYDYDGNGNRLSLVTPSGTVSSQSDARDRLMKAGTRTYAYRPDGELHQKTDGALITQYDYDVLGGLTHVSLPNGHQVKYGLDATGRRIAKYYDGALQRGFLWDGTRVVAELDGASKLVSRFVYAERGTVPSLMLQGGKVYRIVADLQGSPRLVIDAATGAVAQRMDYDDYGNVTTDSSPGLQPFGFAGGLHDPDTGLVRFGARDYDAQTGRWLTRDPALFAGLDANLYEYAGGDPVNGIDMTGRVVLTLGGEWTGVAGGASALFGLGVYWDTQTNDFGVYGVGGIGSGSGIETGLGGELGCYPDLAAFQGRGIEAGAAASPTAGGVNIGYNGSLDEDGHHVGSGLDVGVGVGTGAYVILSNTGTVGIHDIVNLFSPGPSTPKP